MANYGKLFSRIWTDPDFTALDCAAQQVYCLLISYSTRDHAGVLPMTLKRWAKCTKGATVATIQAALAVLVEKNFLVVDWDTEEVLIRTFIRNDEVYRQPKVMVSALKSAGMVESERLRWALHDELSRLPAHTNDDKTAQLSNALVEGLSRDDLASQEYSTGRVSDSPGEPFAKAPGVGGYLSTVGEAPTPTPATAPAPDNDTAAPACIETGARPAKRHPSSSSKTVVRQVLGNAGYPRTILERLAVQAEKLYQEGHPDQLIRESLAEWDRRPEGTKPEFLATILGDVVKKSRATSNVSAFERKKANNAAVFEALATPPRQELTP